MYILKSKSILKIVGDILGLSLRKEIKIEFCCVLKFDSRNGN